MKVVIFIQHLALQELTVPQNHQMRLVIACLVMQLNTVIQLVKFQLQIFVLQDSFVCKVRMLVQVLM